MIDYDGSGSLSRDEVAQLLRDQGISVDHKYLDGVLDAYDLDQSGEIDLGVLCPTRRTHSHASLPPLLASASASVQCSVFAKHCCWVDR